MVQQSRKPALELQDPTVRVRLPISDRDTRSTRWSTRCSSTRESRRSAAPSERRCARSMPRRSLRWPRLRSAAAAPARPPTGRVRVRRSNEATRSGEIGQTGHGHPASPLLNWPLPGTTHDGPPDRQGVRVGGGLHAPERTGAQTPDMIGTPSRGTPSRGPSRLRGAPRDRGCNRQAAGRARDRCTAPQPNGPPARSRGGVGRAAAPRSSA